MRLRVFTTLCFGLFMTAVTTDAAIFHVEKHGNDSGSGASASPWRTIQKAADSVNSGDRVLVGAGEYDETVTITRSGNASERIVFDGQGVATVHRIILSQPYITVENFTVSGYTNTWFHGLIDIREGAHFSIITNCLIRPTIPYLGGIEMAQGEVKPFDDDAPNNCLIVSNTITEVIGRVGFNIFGTNNLFMGNSVTNLYKSDFVRLWGRWNIVRGNTFANMLDHTISNHPDFIQTFGQNGDGSKGHIIEGNYVANIPNGQLSQLTRSDGQSDPLGETPEEMGDCTFRNNVFANIALQASCSIPDMKWYNNVFYRCNYDGGHALVFGDSSRGNADGYRILNNVFLDCGRPGSNNSGWYASVRPDGSAWADVMFDWNYVGKGDFAPVRTSNPPSAFRWFEPNGVNGGDPSFVQVSAGDFHLSPASFLVDRGTTITSFRHDSDDQIRPVGAAWDIGPFEYAPASGDPIRTLSPHSLTIIAE